MELRAETWGVYISDQTIHELYTDIVLCLCGDGPTNLKRVAITSPVL